MLVHTNSEKNFPQFNKKNLLYKNPLDKLENNAKNFQVTDPEVFFNSKKKNTILVWGIVFCGLIFFASYLLDVEWSTVLGLFSGITLKPRFLFTVAFSLTIFIFNEFILQILGHKIRCGKNLQHVGLKEWIGFILTSFFIQSITPFAIGAEAFAIWWFKKRGMSLQESCATVAVSTFCWFCGQFLITWPSVIYMTYTNWDSIINFSVDSIYWLILVGIFFDIFIWLMLFLISYNKHIHYLFAFVNNRVKYWISISWLGKKCNYGYIDYIDKSELAYQYLINHTFKRLYLAKLKTKISVLSVILFSIQSLATYALFALIISLFDDQANFWDFFNIINTSTTANDFLPVPSAEGSLQLTITKLGKAFSASTDVNKIKVTVLLWRTFCKYIGLFLSVAYLAIFGFTQSQKTKSHDQLWDCC